MNCCPELHELLAEDAAGAAARAHAQSCARCASLLARWREFEGGAVTAPAADAADAEARLAAMIAREFGEAPAAPVSAPAPLPLPPRETPMPWALPLAAAAALVIASVWMLQRAHAPSEAPALRGETHGSVAARVTRDASGALSLEWDAVPGADAYRIELVTDAMQVAGTAGPFTEAHATLSADALHEATALRVVAYSGSRLLVRGVPVPATPR